MRCVSDDTLLIACFNSFVSLVFCSTTRLITVATLSDVATPLSPVTLPFASTVKVDVFTLPILEIESFNCFTFTTSVSATPA